MSKTSGRQRYEHLSPEQMDAAVREVFSLARAQGVRVALIGGYALQLYQSPRLTGDVDFITDDLVDGLPLGEPLEFNGKPGGYQVVASNRVVVDLIMRTDWAGRLYDDALSRSTRPRGALAPVASLEHLLAMKMEAGRGKDEYDIDYIVSLKDFDAAKARRIVKKFFGDYAIRELDARVLEAEFTNSKLKKNKRR